jgi:anaerobic sulfite reductase subunit B
MINPLLPISARVLDISEDSTDTRTMTFQLIDEPSRLEAKPGQFFMLHLPGVGEIALTFCQLPSEENCFKAIVKKTGHVTGALWAVQKNQIMGFKGPLGQGWPLPQLIGQPVLMITGGIGLAPVASLIDYLIADHKSGVTLIHGVRDPKSRVMRGDLDRWRDQIDLLETFDLLDSKPATNSEQNGVMLQGTPIDGLIQIPHLLENTASSVICCGPEVMMGGVAEVLLAKGLSAEQIWVSLERRMHCGVGLCGHCYCGNSMVCIEGPTYNWQRYLALQEL